MPDFVHTGDIHLDSAFSAHLNKDDAMRRRYDVMHNMSEIIRLAADKDLLLISGDLFDNQKVCDDTVSFVRRKFAEIPNTHIFISAGNHDPYNSDSVYAKINFGRNVHIFGREPECVELSEIKTRVCGVSFPNAAPGKLKFPMFGKKEGFSTILVIHADLTSNRNSVYNPVSLKDIESCGADYVALGHIHKRSEPKKAGNTTYAYCGIPEGRGFDECGDCGCYIGQIYNGVTTVEFKKTCIRRLFDIKLDISDANDRFHIAELASREIQKVGKPDDLYRINLCGRTNLSDINCEMLKDALSSYGFISEISDMTKADFNRNVLAEENSVCGEFVRNIDSLARLWKNEFSLNHFEKEKVNSFLNRYTKGEVEFSKIDAELLNEAEKIGLASLLRGD